MGIFGKSSNVRGEDDNFWNPIESISQLDEIEKSSFFTPACIFKHSTGCGISRFVLKQFEKERREVGKAELYYLDLLKHRDISDEIAARFGVVHQSPQIILIKNGKAIYDASHDRIRAGDLYRLT